MTTADSQIPDVPVLTPAERELATRPFGFAAVQLILLALGLLWCLGIGWEIYRSVNEGAAAKPEDPGLVQRVLTASLFAVACFVGAAIIPVRREGVRIALLMIVAGGIVHVCAQAAYLAWREGSESHWLAVTGILLSRLVVVLVLANLILWFLRNDVRAWYEPLPAWFPRAEASSAPLLP